MDYNKFKLLLIGLICWRMSFAQNLNNISYEIKSLYGQPDFHSVDLTWEVEDKYATNRINSDDDDDEDEHKNELPKSFVIHYCEKQDWDMQRCNSRVLTDSDDVEYEKGTSKIYKITIKNLRMATTYSFNVRPKRISDMTKSARSESFLQQDKTGSSIIIPTKGFSAVATKCLPNESEIEVQTGPNFGGKIASENGECEIQGDLKDARESYVMRIDHERCGSQVSHDDLTVETYITVQENSGILTHSTRRFLVVCTFQPDTLTVRARLALPKKGDAIPENDDVWIDRERSSRNRQFKMVDKSALILKESSEHSVENAIGDIENLTEKILAKDSTQFSTQIFNREKKVASSFKNPRFSRYATEQEKSTSLFQFEFDTIFGTTVGIAIIVLIILIALYIISRNRNGMKNIKKLHTHTALYN